MKCLQLEILLVFWLCFCVCVKTLPVAQTTTTTTTTTTTKTFTTTTTTPTSTTPSSTPTTELTSSSTPTTPTTTPWDTTTLPLSDCPNNCSDHGMCVEDGFYAPHPGPYCMCNSEGLYVDWAGEDCSYELDIFHDWDYINCHGGLWGGETDGTLGRCCECPNNWGGEDCTECLTDYSCQHPNIIYDWYSPNATCDKSMIMVKQKYFNCSITNEEVNYMLKGNGSVTLGCTFPTNSYTDGQCEYSIFRYPIGPPLWFNCTSTECTQTIVASGGIFLDCLKTTCHPTSLCNSIVKQIVEMVHSATHFHCTLDGFCTFIQDDLQNMLPTIDLICQGSECRNFSTIPPEPPSEPMLSRQQVIIVSCSVGGFCSICLFFFALYTEHLYLKSMWKKKLAQEHEPATITFRDVSWHIKSKIKMPNGTKCWSFKSIITKINGVMHAGQLTAILGASGAGKTTFLDILAGRKNTGLIEGEILINGEPRCKNFSRASGYVTQDDVLMGTLTCREHLMFVARLRLPACYSLKEKKAKVNEVLEELALTHCANQRIGTPDHRGISGGERKRLCIATELLISPRIIFLDEPTSGLDSFNASSLIETLKNLAHKKNRTIIISIHQPRSDIFSLFDSVMLLGHGHMIFYGPTAQVVPFFDSVGYSCPASFNPADYIIDTVSDMKVTSTILNRKRSLLKEDDQFASLIVIHEAPGPSINTVPVDESDEQTRLLYSTDVMSKNPAYSSSWASQFIYLSHRTLVNSVRNAYLIPLQYISIILISLALGGLYWDVSADLSQGGIQDRFGCIFFMVVLLGFNSITAIDVFFTERLLYSREHTNGYYRSSSYFISKALCDIVPQRVIPTIQMGVITYWMMGFRTDQTYHFFFFVLCLVLISITSTAFCFCVSSIISSVSMGNLVMIIFTFASLLFGGLIVLKTGMSWYIEWLVYFSYVNYGFEAMCTNEFNDQFFNFDPSGYDITYINGREMIVNMGMDPDATTFDIIALAVMAGVFMIASYPLLRFCVKEKR